MRTRVGTEGPRGGAAVGEGWRAGDRWPLGNAGPVADRGGWIRPRSWAWGAETCAFRPTMSATRPAAVTAAASSSTTRRPDDRPVIGSDLHGAATHAVERHA